MRSFRFIAILYVSLFLTTTLSAQRAADFRSVVEKRLAEAKLELKDVCPVDTNVVAHRVFKDYGAMYVANSTVRYPTKCVFSSEEEVAAFQNDIPTTLETVSGRAITLQTPAMIALKEAVAAAAKKRLTITPRGATAAKRGYADTFRIWNSRFEPGLNHWVRQGKITAADAIKARQADTIDQVAQVIEWETSGWWFSTGMNRSIFSSVAAPGTSQHLSMVALDVAEFGNVEVRQILNEHGWYQTIIDDTPHFTYLGLKGSELPARGLKLQFAGQFTFWIPNFDR
ncbi:MAG: hypothetical protein H0V76_01415 [Blastocatellia bacterium]|nr:hypothetical protein [Blastocatellia bacterium]